MAKDNPYGAAIRSICDSARADFRKATWWERLGARICRMRRQMIRQRYLRAPIVKALVDIAESARIPVKAPEHSRWTFEAKDGWRVLVYYDGGEFDYIEQFIDYKGHPVDFWNWPDCPERQALINWRPR